MLEARQQLLTNPLLNINYEDGNISLPAAVGSRKNKHLDDSGWPLLQQMSDKNKNLLGPKSPQFYVIHSVKGDSEEQDPVNCANVSDSDESLKLP
jgi:hypothetical protein